MSKETVRIVNAESITIDKSSYTCKVEDSFYLFATVLPTTTTDKSISWSSSDESVVVVSEGVVVAISEGSAVVTASTHNGIKATCIVVVESDVV